VWWCCKWYFAIATEVQGSEVKLSGSSKVNARHHNAELAGEKNKIYHHVPAAEKEPGSKKRLW
jgi:hypothetical protein